MKKYLLLCSIIGLQSCKTILLNTMIKDPQVENSSTITKFLNENKFSTKNVGLLKGDTSHLERNLFKGLETGYLIFDREGNHLCYNGAATCGGVQFRQLITNGNDSFKICIKDNLHLENVLKDAIRLNGEEFDLTSMPKTEYFVVTYWQKFMGGKKNYRDGSEWMESLGKDTTKFTFFKINTDMQESWGLKQGGKANLKIKKTKSGLTMTLDDIPYK